MNSELQKCIDVVNAGYAAFMPMASRIQECEPSSCSDYPQSHHHLVIPCDRRIGVETIVEETLEPLFAAFFKDVAGRFENKLSNLNLRFAVGEKKSLRVTLDGSHGRVWPGDGYSGKLHIEQSISYGGTVVYRVERVDDANVHRFPVATIGWHTKSTDYETVMDQLRGMGMQREDKVMKQDRCAGINKSIILDDGYKVRKLIAKLGKEPE
jgi:hypothetical protein